MDISFTRTIRGHLPQDVLDKMDKEAVLALRTTLRKSTEDFTVVVIISWCVPSVPLRPCSLRSWNLLSGGCYNLLLPINRNETRLLEIAPQLHLSSIEEVKQFVRGVIIKKGGQETASPAVFGFDLEDHARKWYVFLLYLSQKTIASPRSWQSALIC